jgi:hypothetical protein
MLDTNKAASYGTLSQQSVSKGTGKSRNYKFIAVLVIGVLGLLSFVLFHSNSDTSPNQLPTKSIVSDMSRAPIKAETSQATYIVSLHICDAQYAGDDIGSTGTASNLYQIEITGSSGSSSGLLDLTAENSNQHNVLGRNYFNVFRYTIDDIGDPTNIQFTTESTDGLCIDMVNIAKLGTNINSGYWQEFWLDNECGTLTPCDSTHDLELLDDCEEYSGNSFSKKSKKKEKILKTQDLEDTNIYFVTFHVCAETYAGTDDLIQVKISGEDGDSEWTNLVNLEAMNTNDDGAYEYEKDGVYIVGFETSEDIGYQIDQVQMKIITSNAICIDNVISSDAWWPEAAHASNEKFWLDNDSEYADNNGCDKSFSPCDQAHEWSLTCS